MKGKKCQKPEIGLNPTNCTWIIIGYLFSYKVFYVVLISEIKVAQDLSSVPARPK